MKFRRRKHQHRWKPMGAVSFTVYSDLGTGRTYDRQQPALIYACECGEWKYRDLYHGHGNVMFP